jgi:hypothetical protein
MNAGIIKEINDSGNECYTNEYKKKSKTIENHVI